MRQTGRGPLCRACGEPITFIKTVNNKYMPVERTVVKGGQLKGDRLLWTES